MATPKRLTRTYHYKGVIYTPSTPSGKVPSELWDREKELDSPQAQKKRELRYGTMPLSKMENLVPKSVNEESPEEEE